MNINDFAKIVLQSINQYGVGRDNRFLLDVVPALGKVGPQFYKNIDSPAALNNYIKFVNSGAVEFNGEEDAKPLATKSYWNRGYQDFLYTMKILPMIREKLPSAYETAFDGKTILPSGLQSQDDPNAKTIWNAVEEADQDKVETAGKQKEKSSLAKTFIQSDDRQKQNLVKDGLEKVGETNLNSNQLTNVVKFITNFLKS